MALSIIMADNDDWMKTDTKLKQVTEEHLGSKSRK